MLIECRQGYSDINNRSPGDPHTDLVISIGESGELVGNLIGVDIDIQLHFHEAKVSSMVVYIACGILKIGVVKIIGSILREHFRSGLIFLTCWRC